MHRSWVVAVLWKAAGGGSLIAAYILSPHGRGRACPARGFSREWAAAEGFRGVGDAAPYVGGCPLTGSRANLRRGVGTPPYGCNSRKRGRCGHSLMGQSVGRGLDPSAAFRPTIVTGPSAGEGFIPPGAFAFPLNAGPPPPTLSQLYHTLFPPPLQGVVKISLQIFLSICVIIEKV